MKQALIRTPSPGLAGKILLLPACIAGALLLALLGEHFRAMATPATQALDSSRQVMFIARPDGSVQALHLRHTVAELGVLREPDRHAIRELALDASGAHLWVLGENTVWHYDARSLKLLGRSPLARSDSLSRGGTEAAAATIPRPL